MHRKSQKVMYVFTFWWLCQCQFAQASPAHLFAETTYKPRLEWDFKGGNLRSLTRMGALMPLYQSQSGLVFANLFALLDSQWSQEGNVGLGYRHRFAESILGVYGFWDRRKSGHGNLFSQWTLGTEWLKEHLELRVNAYIPTTSRKPLNRIFKRGRSQMAFVQPGFEQALGGYDVEVGGHLPRVPFVHGFVSFYHFMGRGVKPVHGIRIRSRVDVNAYIKLEAEVSHDRLRDTNVLAGVKLTLPLDGLGTSNKGLTGLEAKMTQMVVRDIDIVTASTKTNKVFRMDGDGIGHEFPDHTSSPSPTMADDLATLGLSTEADWDIIKQSYRGLMKTLHPDKQAKQMFQDGTQEERFHSVRDAYERLEQHFQAQMPADRHPHPKTADGAHHQQATHVASKALLGWQKAADEHQASDGVMVAQHHSVTLNGDIVFSTWQLAGGERSGVRALHFTSSHEAWVERDDGHRLKVNPWDVVGIPNHLPNQHLNTFLSQNRFKVSQAGHDIRVRIDGRLRGGMFGSFSNVSFRGDRGFQINLGGQPLGGSSVPMAPMRREFVVAQPSTTAFSVPRSISSLNSAPQPSFSPAPRMSAIPSSATMSPIPQPSTLNCSPLPSHMTPSTGSSVPSTSSVALAPLRREFVPIENQAPRYETPKSLLAVMPEPYQEIFGKDGSGDTGGVIKVPLRATSSSSSLVRETSTSSDTVGTASSTSSVPHAPLRREFVPPQASPSMQDVLMGFRSYEDQPERIFTPTSRLAYELKEPHIQATLSQEQHQSLQSIHQEASQLHQDALAFEASHNAQTSSHYAQLAQGWVLGEEAQTLSPARRYHRAKNLLAQMASHGDDNPQQTLIDWSKLQERYQALGGKLDSLGPQASNAVEDNMSWMRDDTQHRLLQMFTEKGYYQDYQHTKERLEKLVDELAPVVETSAENTASSSSSMPSTKSEASDGDESLARNISETTAAATKNIDDDVAASYTDPQSGSSQGFDGDTTVLKTWDALVEEHQLSHEEQLKVLQLLEHEEMSQTSQEGARDWSFSQVHMQITMTQENGWQQSLRKNW